MRDLVGIDLSREAVTDTTLLMKLPLLPLANELISALFDEINARLAVQRLLMR